MSTWLVTGCSSGIGRGIAEAALARGEQVVVTARKPETVADLVAQYPETALAVALDVTDEASIASAVAAAQAKFGTIDILINNAGYGYRAAVEEGEKSGIDEVFQTNVFGPVNLMKAVLPGMRAQKSGAIVNLSSIAAVCAAPGSGYYAATKAALESISEALYQEVGPLGIKVMVVEPGAFKTHFFDTSLKGTAVKIEDYTPTAGQRRKEVAINKGDQPGDPAKGGKVIVDTILKDKPPFRLALGSDAVAYIKEIGELKKAEYGAWAEISKTTDRDDLKK